MDLILFCHMKVRPEEVAVEAATGEVAAVEDSAVDAAGIAVVAVVAADGVEAEVSFQFLFCFFFSILYNFSTIQNFL